MAFKLIVLTLISIERADILRIHKVKMNKNLTLLLFNADSTIVAI